MNIKPSKPKIRNLNKRGFLLILLALVSFGSIAQPLDTIRHLHRFRPSPAGGGTVITDSSLLKMDKRRAVVHFNSSLTYNQKIGILAGTPIIDTSALSWLHSETTAIVELKKGFTLSQVADSIELIRSRNSGSVRSAYPYWGVAPDSTMYDTSTVYAPYNKILVRVKTNITYLELDSLLITKNCSLLYQNSYDIFNFAVELSDTVNVDAFSKCNELLATGYFEYAEPDFIIFTQLYSVPNDTFYPLQWGLRNYANNFPYPWESVIHYDINGFDSTLADSFDIKAEPAWDIINNCTSIRIAVLDDGVDTRHEDMTVLSGVDFIGTNSNGHPYLDDAHGTAVAGIAAATRNNSLGVAGVSQATILPLRVFLGHYVDPWNRLRLGYNSTIEGIADAINYAWSTGEADVINMSFGGPLDLAAFETAVSNAATYGRDGKGSVLVGSAGNDGSTTPMYPASYTSVISVVAMNPRGYMQSGNYLYYALDPEWSSTHGDSVDICAPGVGITTCDVMNDTGYSFRGESYYNIAAYGENYTANFNGTSSAAPFVSGVAALMLSANSDLTVADVRRIIGTNAQKFRSGNDYINIYTYQNVSHKPYGTWSAAMGYGCVNAYRSIINSIGIKYRLVNCSTAVFSSGLCGYSGSYHWIINGDTFNIAEPQYNFTFTDSNYVRLVIGPGRRDTIIKYMSLNPPSSVTIYSNGTNIGPGLSNHVALDSISLIFNQWQHFYWYRDSVLMIGNYDAPDIPVDLPGTYFVVVTSPCGSARSNAITLRSSCLSLSIPIGQQYPGGIIVTGTTNLTARDGYYINGTVRVQPGTTLNILHTKILFGQCAELIVEKGGTLVMDSALLYSCRSWKGIVVHGDKTTGSNRMLTTGTHGNAHITNSYIGNAFIGVLSIDGGYLDITSNIFEKNYSHIMVAGYPYDHESKIDSNRFHNLEYLPFTCIDSLRNRNVSRNRSQVFARSAQHLFYRNNSFVCGNINDHPNYATGYEATSCSTLTFKNNRFYGWMNYAIRFTNTNNSQIGADTVNGDPLIPPYTSHDVRRVKNGFYLKESHGNTVDYNKLYNCVYGIEYYSTNGSGATTTLYHNQLDYITYGVVSAPFSNPIENTNISVNTQTNSINLQVNCNKFNNNNLCIIGSGNLMTQGSTTLPGEDASNMFNSTINWNGLWQYSSVLTYVNKVGAYDSYMDQFAASPLAGGSFNLNGTSQSSNFLRKSNYISATYCWGSWKNSGTSVEEPEEEILDAYVAYPNPANDELRISRNSELTSYWHIELYDMLGKLVYTGQKTLSSEISVNSSNFDTGVYLIRIIGENGQSSYKKVIIKH